MVVGLRPNVVVETLLRLHPQINSLKTLVSVPFGDKPEKKSLLDRAEGVKNASQWLIALGIFALLIFKVFFSVWHLFGPLPTWPPITALMTSKPLDIVGQGLAASAAVQLAYMLLTPSLDEAVEPVILGIAATILLLVSKMDVLKIREALCVLLLVLTIAILFVLKKYFLDGPKKTPNPEEAN
jgi:hypothetical protein